MSRGKYLRPRDIGLNLTHPSETELLLWLTAVLLGVGPGSRSRGRRAFEGLLSSGIFSASVSLPTLSSAVRTLSPTLAELYSVLSDVYGSVAAIANTAADHRDLMRRIGELPGFSSSRARRFLAGLQLAWPKARPFPGDVERYDHWFIQNAAAFRAEVAALREFVPKGADAVEIGGGSGRFARELGIGTIIEPDPAFGRLAKRRGLRVVTAAAEELPFPDASFNLLLMVTVVCFLVLPELAFSEAYRVLRPGGRLVVGIVDAKSTLGRDLRRRREPGSYYRFARFFSVDRLSRVLSASAFRVQGYRQTLLSSDPLRSFTVKEGHGDGGFVALSAERQ